MKIAIVENGFHRGHYRDSRNTGGNSFPLQKSDLSILPELIKVIKRVRCSIRISQNNVNNCLFRY